jgi:hypothetical protein
MLMGLVRDLLLLLLCLAPHLLLPLSLLQAC